MAHYTRASSGSCSSGCSVCSSTQAITLDSQDESLTGFVQQSPLDATNYAAARAAMMNFRSDTGRILGIKPNVLVVPPSLEAAALALVNTEYGSAGASNPWKGTADLIVTPFVL